MPRWQVAMGFNVVFCLLSSAHHARGSALSGLFSEVPARLRRTNSELHTHTYKSDASCLLHVGNYFDGTPSARPGQPAAAAAAPIAMGCSSWHSFYLHCAHSKAAHSLHLQTSRGDVPSPSRSPLPSSSLSCNLRVQRTSNNKVPAFQYAQSPAEGSPTSEALPTWIWVSSSRESCERDAFCIALKDSSLGGHLVANAALL